MTGPPSAAQRRTALIEQHGRARAASPAEHDQVLSALGLKVSPRDVLVFFYRDQAAADAYAESNRTWTGATSLGTIPAGNEIAGVLDLRSLLPHDQPH